MVNKSTCQMTHQKQLKEEKWNRQIGNNPRLGLASNNRHLRYQLARRLRHSKSFKNVNLRRYKNSAQIKHVLTTRDKLRNIWNSIKLLFTSDDDVYYHRLQSSTSNNESQYYYNPITKSGTTPNLGTPSFYTREDSSRSTIDTTLEYMPVQQENVSISGDNLVGHEPKTKSNNSHNDNNGYNDDNTNNAEQYNGTKEDPRDETIVKLKEQVVLLKKKLKYAREKNTLYKSLLDEANIGTTYLESRRHIKNLVRDNMKPESELPPSPERKVYPLVTSSPIRQNIGATTTTSANKPTSSSSTTSYQNDAVRAPPQMKSYYNKYPKLPHTESLIKREPANNDEENKEQRL